MHLHACTRPQKSRTWHEAPERTWGPLRPEGTGGFSAGSVLIGVNGRTTEGWMTGRTTRIHRPIAACCWQQRQIIIIIMLSLSKPLSPTQPLRISFFSHFLLPPANVFQRLGLILITTSAECYHYWNRNYAVRTRTRKSGLRLKTLLFVWFRPMTELRSKSRGILVSQ